MLITRAEAILLTPKSGLPKCNVLLSVLISRWKVCSEEQAGALRGSNRRRNQKSGYDIRRL
jgi:hypothetical protein